MRNLGNPFRSFTARSGVVVVLVGLLFAIAIAGGTATAGRGTKPKAPPAARGTAYAAERALHAALAQVPARLEEVERHAVAAARRTKTSRLSFAYGAAADGAQVYAAVLSIRILRRHGRTVGWRDVRMKIVRTDRTTGTKTVLLDKRNTFPLRIDARGGRVALQTYAFGSLEDSGEARSAIYAGGATDPALTVIDARPLPSLDSESFCGQFNLLSGLSDAGEPLISELRADCSDGPTDDFASELTVRRNSGTVERLGRLSPDSFTSPAAVVLTGDRLTELNPFENSFATRRLSEDQLTNLWSPGAQYSDTAADGTVALIGEPPPEPFYPGDFTDGYPVSTGTGTGTGTGGGTGTGTGGGTAADPPPPAVAPPPGGLGTSPARPAPKFPFVVFPGGDAENPVLVSSSRSRAAGVKICGSNLYLLEYRDPDSDISDLLSSLLGPGMFVLYFSYARYEITLYDTQGRFVRKLAKTKHLRATNVGCNGDRLLISAIQGTSANATEVGP